MKPRTRMSNHSAIPGPADRRPRAETDVQPGMAGEAVAVDCTDDGPVGHDRENRHDRAGRDRGCQAPALARGGSRLGRFQDQVSCKRAGIRVNPVMGSVR
jgi:hypothetical protein